MPLTESNGVVDTSLVYPNNPSTNAAHMTTSQVSAQLQMPTSDMPSDYLLFSTMSNDQLNEAINNTDVGLDALWEDFQFQQPSELDWMDWSTFA